MGNQVINASRRRESGHIGLLEGTSAANCSSNRVSAKKIGKGRPAWDILRSCGECTAAVVFEPRRRRRSHMSSLLCVLGSYPSCSLASCVLSGRFGNHRSYCRFVYIRYRGKWAKVVEHGVDDLSPISGLRGQTIGGIGYLTLVVYNIGQL